MPPSPAPRRIAVIGGGITGLAAAHRLLELEPAAKVTLFEASGRLGGVLQTVRKDGYLIERAADMLTTREPWAVDLCRRVGIESELIETNRENRRALVVRQGKLIPVPEGFTLMSPAKIWPVVTTPLLSPLGKLRIAWEYFTPKKKDDADESLESFVVRRFGREAFDRLIQPLIGGIYTADPAKLSMRATLPQFVELERKAGSLIAGLRGQASENTRPEPGDRGQGTGDKSHGSGARYGLFLAPRDGMERLVQAVAAKLPQAVVRLNAAVERVERISASAGWRITVAGQSQTEEFDALILAASAPVSGRLLQPIDSELAGLITSIPQSGCTVAVLGIKRDQLPSPPAGFGIVVPAIEKRRIIAASFSSIKFAGRAPEGKLLLRVFIGGALQPELAALPDDVIRKVVLEELRSLLGLQGEPEFIEVVRWLGAMPQYHVGHPDLVRRIEELVAVIPHLEVVGNSFRGVGIPFCIRDGELAAERLLAPSAPGRGPG